MCYFSIKFYTTFKAMSIKSVNPIDQENWFALIQTLSCYRVQNFTQGEIADILKVSRKTIIEFEKGNLYDIRLLWTYAGFFSHNITLNL